MHFSRMHTTCLLPVSPSMHCAGGCLLLGGYLLPGGVCYQWEWASATRVGVCYQGELCYGGVSATRGYLLLRGVCYYGVCIPACTEADTPPVNRMTDRCKNITFAFVCQGGQNKFSIKTLNQKETTQTNK